MSLPQVVIVGRPNVGKSSLFNWLAGRRLAIVDKVAGVTRDRITHLLCEKERFFELVDTGGLGFDDPDKLTPQIEEQINAALEEAAVILFVVDARDGLTPLDHEVAKRLRYVEAPVICVANKCDDSTIDANTDEFYKLGRGKLVCTSPLQNRNRQELVDMIVSRFPPVLPENLAPPEPEMKVAIVGRRNVGKSTFVNTLAQAERMIVSEVPGTTRDSVDVRFELDGKVFTAIDTPGLKRTRSITSDVDFYSLHRAQRSIRRADVVLMFFDPTQRISKVDKQLVDYIGQQYRPCIFVINKWDLQHRSMPTEKWVNYIHDTFRGMWHVPIAFVTGQTGKNVKALLNHSQMLYKQSRQRVATSDLNKLLRATIDANPPPIHLNRQPKIFFATQVGVQPPTIVLFCSNPGGISQTYRRYLLGVFHDRLPYAEVPIKLYLRRREERDKPPPGIELPPDTEAPDTEVPPVEDAANEA